MPGRAANFRLLEITIDCVEPARVAAFWSALLDAPTRVPMEGWVRLGPLSEGGPLLNCQPVPEPKRGKTRIHLDLQTDDLAGAMSTVERLGGRSTGERHDYDQGSVVVMTDPEGNEFCLVEYRDGAGPA